LAEMFRLPDLPTAGYATARERELTDMVMVFMRVMERDRLRLLTVVCEGREKWRRVAGSVLPSWATDDLLDAMFHYFELQACLPDMQRRLLDAKNNPDIWRMLMHEAMPDIERQREQVRQLQAMGGVDEQTCARCGAPKAQHVNVAQEDGDVLVCPRAMESTHG